MERIRVLDFDPPRSRRSERNESLQVKEYSGKFIQERLDEIRRNRRDLGDGKTAEVFSSNEPGDRSVCVKLLIPEAERAPNDVFEELRLLIEAEQAGVNVPKGLTAFREPNGEEGLFMTTVRGVSLEDIFTNRAPLPEAFRANPQRLLEFREQLDTQLNKLHDAAGIQHRDLHLGNIMINEARNCEPYLIDFGKAKRLYGNGDAPFEEQTERGIISYASDRETLQNSWQQFIQYLLQQGIVGK